MTPADLVRLVDGLEERASSYVTLEEVESAAGDVSAAIDEGLLLVDFRQRADGTQVTLCRLNRRHPLVKNLTAW